MISVYVVPLKEMTNSPLSHVERKMENYVHINFNRMKWVRSNKMNSPKKSLVNDTLHVCVSLRFVDAVVVLIVGLTCGVVFIFFCIFFPLRFLLSIVVAGGVYADWFQKKGGKVRGLCSSLWLFFLCVSALQTYSNSIRCMCHGWLYYLVCRHLVLLPNENDAYVWSRGLL
eukprot:m.78682 g.78682  ORF g.78682 m.78682 type:complete len:171 (-) comp11962_c0_seq3:249-761(-)